MSQQNNARLMCEYPIFGTVSDVSRMNTGVIYVRPCYFKPGVDKEIPIFLRDAKKEHWATKENLKVGTKLTFRIRVDQYKGPMATDLTTVDVAPKDAYFELDRPECIPDARGFRRLIDAARSKKLRASSNPVYHPSDSEYLGPIWPGLDEVYAVIKGEKRLSIKQTHEAIMLAYCVFGNDEDTTIFAKAVIETILDEDYDWNDKKAVYALFNEKYNSLVG